MLCWQPVNGLPTVRQKGEILPKTSTMAQILKAEEINSAANDMAVLVPVVLDKGRTVRANLTLDAGLLEAIDAKAEKRGLSRSCNRVID
jgi:pyrimidine operon attenuation protein/uracil phosphoribosyltransferase